jgi:hypothetical protein
MAKKQSKGSERPPPVDKLIKPAVGIALAIVAYQFFTGIKSEVRETKETLFHFRLTLI